MPTTIQVARLKERIRDVADFPRKGIIFKDITTLIKDGDALKLVADLLVEEAKKMNVDVVAGIESRGFIFAPIVANRLGVGFVPIRKKGKLPHKKVTITYSLEYGKDSLEIHKDAVNRGDRVLVIDDVLATGGTSKSVAKLIERLGGVVEGFGFLIELSFLKGRSKIKKYPVFSLIQY